MISIIICSRHNKISGTLFQNINDTIGTPFEIVCIDNSQGKYNMCSAYNEGVRRAKGEYLCFMHEDVTFLNGNWGTKAIDECSHDDVGLLGIVGTTYFDQSFIYWPFNPFAIGHHWHGEEHRIFNQDLSLQNAVAVDGMWLFTKAELFKSKLFWDESTYKGFDFYDMDMCMQVISAGLRIKIMPQIHIDHASDGNYKPVFYENCKSFHKKWDYIFPITARGEIQECMNKSLQSSLQRAIASHDENQMILNMKCIRFALGVHKCLKNLMFWKNGK